MKTLVYKGVTYFAVPDDNPTHVCEGCHFYGADECPGVNVPGDPDDKDLTCCSTPYLHLVEDYSVSSKFLTEKNYMLARLRGEV